MKSLAAIVLGVSLLPAPVLQAQDYDPASLEAMEALRFLEGKWKGKSWSRTREGERIEGRVVEIVESKLNGSILTLEGLGSSGDPEAEGAKLDHHAFAVIHFDPDRGQYRMHSYKDGKFLDAELAMTGEDAARWRFAVPNGGRVRFDIALDEAGRWTETGEWSADGETWMPFFGMTLERVGE